MLLLAGPSGSGKGTVASRLLEDGMVGEHVSMGDLLRSLLADCRGDDAVRARAEAALGGDLPPEAAGLTRVQWLERCLHGGLLVPDAWTEAVISLQLERSPALRAGRWLLDGYPRRVRAAEHLLDTLASLGIPVWRVVHLRLGEERVAERLLARGRADDTPRAIVKRYRFYREQVLPTMAYLARRLGPGMVLDVDAAGAPAEVYGAVLDGLGTSWA